MKKDDYKVPNLFKEGGIQKIRDGDSLALRCFVDHYGEFIMTIMFRFLKNEDDVQECFWQFMAELPKRLISFDFNRPLKPFLWTIARRDALKKLRQASRNPTYGKRAISIDTTQESNIYEPGNIEEIVIQKEGIQLILTVIKSFGVDSSVNAFSLYYIYDYTYNEIAALYKGIEESMVRNRVSRGKAKVIDKLKRDYPEYFHGREP